MDAKSIYKQNNVRIVLDKHMEDVPNCVENNQESGHALRQVSYSTEFDHAQILPVETTIHTENLLNPIQNFAVNFSHHSLTNNTLINSFSDSLIQENASLKEYIGMLEQVIDSLLPRN